jgi:hypothetical protein
MSTARRDFLRSLAVVAAGGSTLGPRLLEAGQGAPRASSDWDMSWRDRLSGPFRAVFDSPDVADGDALWRASIWQSEVAEVFGTPPSDIHAVLVVRHKAIPMVMNHEFWARHQLGREFKIKDPATKRDAQRNPFQGTDDEVDGLASGAGASQEPESPSVSLQALLAQGGIVLACNFAFGRMVALERKAGGAGTSPAEARSRAQAGLIPGVILQPSGFFAVLEAQRAGCGLFPGAA